MPRITLEPRFQVEYLSILDSDGNLDTALEPKLAGEDLRALYRAMVLGRRLDERMVRLQRQGRIGTFAPIKGQEASQMGSAFTLRRVDWMVPSFRETAAMIWRGWPIEKLLLFFAGQLEGGQPALDQHDLPITIPVATQLPHAVGLAYAAQYRCDVRGRLPRSAEFRRGLARSRGLRLPKQPVGDLGAPEEADALAHDRPEGARLRPARHPGGRKRRPRRLRCRARGRRSGARRRRSHADRVRDLSPGRSHDRRRSDQVPDRRRSRDVGAKGPSDPLPRVSGKPESPRDEPRAADRRGDRRGGSSLRVGAARRSAHDVRPRVRRAAGGPQGPAGGDGRA